jgi:hypothetical protein
MFVVLSYGFQELAKQLDDVPLNVCREGRPAEESAGRGIKEFKDKYCKGRGYGRSRRYWVLVAFAILHATYQAPCRIMAV